LTFATYLAAIARRECQIRTPLSPYTCFLRTNQSLWSVLTPPEWKQIWHHVSTCDFLETAAVWCELGREAGFREAQQIFADPTDFFRMFRFDA
jgi:hypothetical protein